MRFSRIIPLLVIALAAGACLPTGEDIEKEIEAALSSVAGPWTGSSPTLTLDFQLQQGTGDAVSGSGTMKETAAAAAVPITVTGTFQRPQLSLTFSGMTFEGRAVQGTFAGKYTTVGGINGPLQLRATGYSKDVTILLQER
ncbi:hypothetical protein [Longimicrobium sp.]|jgi:hypothetical protein|uniref:hypothetical protein n=1 Tax=Longimicrobium sp. TaxID=2029185 RepID=UPI002F92E6D7